ncbi:MAG: tetratricopeptide repeat protein [Rikenellaceae bacterium]
MKKIIMMIAAVLMLSAPATMAQKINEESIKAKLTKSDAAIQNEKKATKAATWISRGDDYMSALQAPTETLFSGMELAMLKIANGEPKSVTTKNIKDVDYEVLVYPYVTVYTYGGRVAGWETTKEIYPGAEKVALDAYAKAFELDAAQAAKAKAGIDKYINHFAQVGDVSNALSNYEAAGKAYLAVYDAQILPAYNDGNSTMLYYAGYMFTIAANEEPTLYANGAEAFRRAIDAGYVETEKADADTEESDKGNIFYYQYHCYYGQKDADASNVMKAKETLVKGVEAFPRNQRIIDALAQLYTTEEGVGDPNELVAMIDNAISSDPNNSDLWYSRGRVYFSLKDYDNSIASFTKVTELAPNLYDGHFYLGLFYIYKGDEVNDKIANATYTENAAYNKDIEALNAVYASAIPILERAHELKPDDLSPVEYLKSLCFRLRDNEAIMAKYTKYNDLFNEMKANN